MTGTKKIFVTKGDEATLVVEKLIDTEASEITIAIPKFSKFAESLANFHLLRREAEVLGKRITVESVDDRVIELCGSAKIPSVNPFFSRSKQFADIVRRDAAAAEKEAPIARKAAAGVKQKFRPAAREAPREEVLPGVPPESSRPNVFVRVGRTFRIRLPRRVWLAAIPLAGLAIMGALTLLPRANIAIIAVTRAWTYEGSVTAEKSVAALDAEAMRIPGQVFRERKNLDVSFPASGRKEVVRKARGTVAIWNAFSSAPQTLVAATRLKAPDGKIFRLAKSVTVPGAKIADGKIEPSSVRAEVVADAAGNAYNIGPVARFSIPGFEGTPKFTGFYATSESVMTGGLVGEAAYPTDEDIRKAREASAASLTNALKTFLLAGIPNDLRFFDATFEFKLVGQTVQTEVGEDGTFSVFTEGELSVVGFRESDVLALLGERLQSESGADMEVRKYSLSYSEESVSRDRDALRIPLVYTSTVARAIDRDAVRTQAAGKSERELRTFIFSLPGLASARISLWPFWVRRVSGDPSRVTVTVE